MLRINLAWHICPLLVTIHSHQGSLFIFNLVNRVECGILVVVLGSIVTAGALRSLIGKHVAIKFHVRVIKNDAIVQGWVDRHAVICVYFNRLVSKFLFAEGVKKLSIVRLVQV